ncbi:hypothetical protein ABT224_35290 [Streptomyces sp. NPDC001584]|uniref:hypothetical protein n=1 Tax=Streptomyces sp. NPDC001584 TaxID=3154521 RepID=UPI0033225975
MTGTLEMHAANLEELMAQPFVPGRWEVTSTGRTYAEKWSTMRGWKERGPFLREAGFRLFVRGHLQTRGRDATICVISPLDVAERVSCALARSVEPNDEEAWNLEALKIFKEVLDAEKRPQ